MVLLREQSLPAIAMPTSATPKPYAVAPDPLNEPVRRTGDQECPVTMKKSEWELREHDARVEHEEWLRGTGWSPPEGREEMDEREHREWATRMLTAIGIALL
jgi:hypothetical protein